MARRRRTYRLLAAMVVGVALVAFFALPTSPLARFTPTASAHGELVRSIPTAGAVLRASPSQVRLEFDDAIAPATSRVRVVDASGRELDRRDVRVGIPNDHVMTVSIPALAPERYVVIWQAQTPDDGHVTSGSFLFAVARPDGTVPSGPAVSAVPPGIEASAPLNGPVVLQTVATWVALLALTFWLGGAAWETWVTYRQPATATDVTDAPTRGKDDDRSWVASSASVRFRRMMPVALIVLLLANLGVLLGIDAQVTGGWSGVANLAVLRATLLGGRFGAFWSLREAMTLGALALALTAGRRGWSRWRGGSHGSVPPAPDEEQRLARDHRQPRAARAAGHAVWWGALRETTAAIAGVPARLAGGWRRCSWYGRAELALGGVALIAFAFSGHAAAVAPERLGYAVSVDLLHLVGMSVWLGGIFYITLVLLPTLAPLDFRARANVLVAVLPAFGALALVTAVILAATGSLNTTIRLTSPLEFLTTVYGRVLAVKIETFLAMIAISAYHAFFLRPQLTRALRQHDGTHDRAGSPAAAQPPAPVSAVEYAATVAGPPVMGTNVAHRAVGGEIQTDDAPAASGAETTGELPQPAMIVNRLEAWLRREALLGVLVLVCVALLAATAGTLGPAASASSGSNAVRAVQVTPGPETQTLRHALGDRVTLRATPLRFGTNRLTVTVMDGTGRPVTGATVQALLENLDTNVGANVVPLRPAGSSQPGVYTGSADFTTTGEWIVNVEVTAPQDIPVRVTFHVRVGAAA